MTRQNLMTILLIVILLGIGFVWFYYFRAIPGTEAPAISEEQINLRADLLQLRRIRNLKLDTSIFDDKFFQSLEAPAVSLPGVGRGTTTPGIGRPNPFIPF